VLSGEMDETLVAKRKHNRGRLVPETRVFGGVSRTTRQRFLAFKLFCTHSVRLNVLG